MERVEHEKQLPEVVLNSGHKMPVLGLGTGKLPPTPTDALVPILIDAIQAGYRHFDTAAFYQTEEAVGQAVAQAIERGLIKSRHDMFITSKLWCSDAHPHLVLPAIKTTLKRLGMEYLDLYLIHWPVRFRQRTTGSKLSKEDILPFDIMGTWEAMEECSRLGLTKSIGVCNFGTMKLSQILHNATIPPAVNQVEMNPSWQQRKLQDFCKEKGIHVTGSSPLGIYGAPSATNTGIDYTILEELAAAKRKSISQIILRSIIQQGVSAVPRSFNKQRMKQNLQIFDWELTDEEMNKIKQISQRRLYAGDFFVSEAGPYKSLEELWDGDP